MGREEGILLEIHTGYLTQHEYRGIQGGVVSGELGDGVERRGFGRQGFFFFPFSSSPFLIRVSFLQASRSKGRWYNTMKLYVVFSFSHAPWKVVCAHSITPLTSFAVNVTTTIH